MNAHDLTTHCGIYCGDCPRFQAPFSDLAAQLLAELDNNNFTAYTKLIGFEHYEKAVSFLKLLIRLKCEIPCRLGGDGCGDTPCEVKKCNLAKELQGCWECGDFETCPQLDFLIPFCGDAPLKNLCKIKAQGIDTWAADREKQYPWR
jgi:hypothetical protein